MKLYKKLTGLAILGIATVSLLAGCAEEEQIEADTKTPVLEKLKGNQITFEHNIEGSIITTNYNLGEYKLEDWKITDSKSIRINAGVKHLKKGTEILIDHVHADVSLKSRSAQLNGLTQDSMDNSYHGSSQDGFLINEKYTYSNIFAIEGFSKDIISGWEFYMGDYGTGEISTSKLTESNLLDRGTYGSQLSVVYNLLIKNPGDTKYHVESFEDRVIIPTHKKVIVKNENTKGEEKSEE